MGRAPRAASPSPGGTTSGKPSEAPSPPVVSSRQNSSFWTPKRKSSAVCIFGALRGFDGRELRSPLRHGRRMHATGRGLPPLARCCEPAPRAPGGDLNEGKENTKGCFGGTLQRG